MSCEKKYLIIFITIFSTLTCGSKRYPSFELPIGPASYGGEPLVKVNLIEGISQIAFSSPGYYNIYDSGMGKLIARVEGGKRWGIKSASDGKEMRVVNDTGKVSLPHTGRIVIEPLRSESYVEFDKKKYRGRIEVSLDGGGRLRIVNEILLEDYLRGVVPAEIGHLPEAEQMAVKAQAVASRTFALEKWIKRQADSAQLSPGISSQVYLGVEMEDALADRCIKDTRGVVILHKGSVINSTFFSNCGGVTAEPLEVWKSGIRVPYLQSVSDKMPRGKEKFYCGKFRNFRWHEVWSKDELETILKENLPRVQEGLTQEEVGKLENISILDRGRSGRIVRLKIETSTGQFIVNKSDIRSVLKPVNSDMLRSTWFDLKIERDREGATKVIAEGRGNGHGVGMCQYGAIGRALNGQRYDQILEAYYPGTRLAKVY